MHGNRTPLSSCLWPQAFMVRHHERWMSLHSHTGWKMSGNRMHPWEFLEAVGPFRCQILPNTLAAPPTQPSSACSQTLQRSGHRTHLPPRQVLGSWQLLRPLAFPLALLWSNSTDCSLGFPGSVSLIMHVSGLPF